MIIDRFRDEHGFPFESYFESVNEYIAAQQYWLNVLRASKGFKELDWEPRERPIEVEQDMYLGKAVDILSFELKKEINIQTSSLLGDANMFFKENSGYSDEEHKEQKNIFGKDFELDEKTLNGMSYEEALNEAKRKSKSSPISAWVENAIHWHPDPKHPEGGYEMNVERLILTSEISEYAETKAIHALELFLQDGSAIERVNSVFSSDGGE
ncbi:MAG: hypothetical protein ACK5NL_16925 [Vibrio fluvialis]